MDEVYRQERNYLTTLMKPGLLSRRLDQIPVKKQEDSRFCLRLRGKIIQRTGGYDRICKL